MWLGIWRPWCVVASQYMFIFFSSYHHIFQQGKARIPWAKTVFFKIVSLFFLFIIMWNTGYFLEKSGYCHMMKEINPDGYFEIEDKLFCQWI